jgi:hypothetical protein
MDTEARFAPDIEVPLASVETCSAATQPGAAGETSRSGEGGGNYSVAKVAEARRAPEGGSARRDRVSAPRKAEVRDRETWITMTFAGGRILRYWGDPEESIDWEEFEGAPELDELDEIPEPPPGDDWGEPAGEIGDHAEARRLEAKAPRRAKMVGKPAPTLAIRMADIEPEPVEWLWHPYIPFGKLTSVEDDPGIGKSWLTMALAAQVPNQTFVGGKTKSAGSGVECPNPAPLPFPERRP